MRITAVLRQAPNLPCAKWRQGMLIEQAMQDENYAQAQELADRVSVSRATLSRLENGDPSVSFETFLRVCQGVGMLDKIPEAVDPYETDLGRIRVDQALPQRVRCVVGRTS